MLHTRFPAPMATRWETEIVGKPPSILDTIMMMMISSAIGVAVVTEEEGRRGDEARARGAAARREPHADTRRVWASHPGHQRAPRARMRHEPWP